MASFTGVSILLVLARHTEAMTIPGEVPNAVYPSLLSRHRDLATLASFGGSLMCFPVHRPLHLANLNVTLP